jgi:hypothetical protein
MQPVVPAGLSYIVATTQVGLAASLIVVALRFLDAAALADISFSKR